MLYLRHSEIDKQKWDDLIERSVQKQVYALSWYLDVVSPGWEAIAAINPDGSYRFCMPLPVRKKLNILYVQQPLFCQQLGFYSQPETENPNLEKALTVLKSKISYIASLHLNTGNFLLKNQAENLVPTDESATHYLLLQNSYEALYGNYSRDRKLNLKRAQKAGLKIEESTDIEPLITFFKDEVAGLIYGGVSGQAYTQLRELYKQLQQRGLAKLLYTSGPDGEKNAGCLFIIYGKKIVYIFNAASRNGRRLNGRTLLLDHIIQQYAGQDFVLDFESPKTTETAIVRVYQGFGAEMAPFQIIRYNNLPAWLRTVKAWRMRIVQKLKN